MTTVVAITYYGVGVVAVAVVIVGVIIDVVVDVVVRGDVGVVILEMLVVLLFVVVLMIHRKTNDAPRRAVTERVQQLHASTRATYNDIFYSTVSYVWTVQGQNLSRDHPSPAETGLCVGI